MAPLITICARGGSQGVKGKNIRSVAGKPLIAYTIEAAIRWGQADRIVVSTDSEQIAAVAREYGAETPFLRPADLGRGEVPKMAVVRHALHAIEAEGRAAYETVIDLDASAPLRHVEDIEQAYTLMTERGPRTVFSVVNARKNPYYNVVEADAEGYVHLSKDMGAPVTARQLAPVVYDMNASIHIYSREYLLDEQNWHVCSDHSLPYVMADLTAVDIDTEDDLRYVDFLLREGVYTP